MNFPTKFNRDAFFVSLIVIFLCYNFGSGEDVRFQYCDSATSKMCRILKLTVDPCPEAVKNEPCNFYKGETMVSTITFIPNFSANDITTQAFGRLVLLYVPDPEQDRKGCHYVKCPIVAGQQQILKYPFNVSRSNFFIPGAYTVKYKLWNTHKPSEECCLLYKANLHSSRP